MKSAGKRSAKTSSFSIGACHWANGIEPESNQTSITSGTRVIVPSHCSQSHVCSSTYGRCGSSSGLPECSLTSASEPSALTCPFSQRQTGSGVPQ